MNNKQSTINERLYTWAEYRLLREIDEPSIVPKKWIKKIKINFEIHLAVCILKLLQSYYPTLATQALLNYPYSNQKKFDAQRCIQIFFGALVVVVISWCAYLRFAKGIDWADWTGFGIYQGNLPKDQRAKTLWDWMELLIIPFVLVLGAYFLNRSENDRRTKIEEQRSRIEREIEVERYKESTLQSYFDKMSELLLDKGLEKTDSEARQVAKARTLTTLEQLDGKRKGILLRFLKDAELIGINNPIISLEGANFSYTNIYKISLIGVDISKADFRFSDLAQIDFESSNLQGVMFSGSNLMNIKFDNANLRNSDFSMCKLSSVSLTNSDVRDVTFVGVGHIRNMSDVLAGPVSAIFKSVTAKRAKYNIATIWPENVDPVKIGAIPDEDGFYDVDMSNLNIGWPNL